MGPGWPRAWGMYGAALAVVMAVGLGRSGYISPHWVQAILLVLPLGLLEVALLFTVRWPIYRWRALLPLALLIVAVPAATRFGQLLVVARFELSRDRYEAIAKAAMARTASQPLRREDRDLAYSIQPMHEEADGAGDVVGVEFGLPPSRLVGRVGYFRFVDPDTEQRILAQPPRRTRWTSSLGGGWYVVHH
jgi:hypothetical protein